MYTLTIVDDNGKKISRKVEVDMPKMSFNYSAYKLGTKFYNTKASKKSYICDEDNDLYGRIVLNDFSVDGMTCELNIDNLPEDGSFIPYPYQAIYNDRQINAV